MKFSCLCYYDRTMFDALQPVGAFFIVEAQDMDEAVQVASKHPGAHVGKFLGGGIEVRACEFFQAA